MSKSIKLLATFGFIAVVAACAREQQVEEFVVIDLRRLWGPCINPRPVHPPDPSAILDWVM